MLYTGLRLLVVLGAVNNLGHLHSQLGLGAFIGDSLKTLVYLLT